MSQYSPPMKKLKTEEGCALSTLFESTSSYGRKLKCNRNGLDVEEVSGISIVDLNDDCLYAIFNWAHMTAMDLCAVAQTCSRIKNIVSRNFKLKHRVCNFDELNVHNPVLASRLFNVFGDVITELKLNAAFFEHSAEDVITSIADNCTSLRCLSLQSYVVPDSRQAFVQLNRLFAKLEVLHIESVCIDNVDIFPNSHGRSLLSQNGNMIDFFVHCTSLIELKVIHCRNVENAILDSFFPNLQTFSIEGIEIKVGGFLLRHNALNSLSVNDYAEDDVDSVYHMNIIAKISDKLQKLEYTTGASEFPITFQLYLGAMDGFDNLTELKIRWLDKNVTHFLHGFRAKSLRTLQLEDINGIPSDALFMSLAPN